MAHPIVTWSGSPFTGLSTAGTVHLVSSQDAYIVELVSTLGAVICGALVFDQLMFTEVANITELRT